MKANELMIGDLVKTNQGDVIKVESISTKRQHRKVGYHTKEDCAHIKYVRQGQIEPIPLTEEILKANGFRSLGHGEYVLEERFTFEVRIYIYDTGNVFKIDNGNLDKIGRNSCHICHQSSVHELQHALRLCGLNNLADNFKVE